MILYHGSRIGGIHQLKPTQADHDRPYVYMTTSEVVAALYLCNAVEKPYYWFPYGFEKDCDIPVYHELYPNALREVSSGVKGYIYEIDAKEEQYIPFPDNPFARLGTTMMDVTRSIEVPDAYVLLQTYLSEGRLQISRFEEKNDRQLAQWHAMIADYMDRKNMICIPDCSYARFIRLKIPDAWQRYLNKIRRNG